MLKIIPTDRVRQGGGRITRFAIELPWFSVWADLCQLELAHFRGQTEDMCDMLVATMGRDIYNSYQDLLRASIMGGIEKIDEQPTITDRPD